MFLQVDSAIPALLATLALTLAGCDGGPAATDAPANSATSTNSAPSHAHPAHGPHGGDLVELGNDEYHAEMVHEADGKLSVHILDGSAQVAVPIEATEITLNIVHDGAPEQFSLAASPTDSDPAGKSSRFVSADAHAGEDLDHEGVQAKLAVTINGTSYQGAIADDHGHDHAHGDHADSDHKR